MTTTLHGLNRVPHDDLESFAKLREVIHAAERADGTPPVSDQAMLAARQGDRALFGVTGDGESDREGDGESAKANQGFVGVAIIGEGEVDLVIHPDARGRGLATAALSEMISAQDHAAPHSTDTNTAPVDSPAAPAAASPAVARAATRAAERPATEPATGAPELRAWAHGENPAATALLTHAGFSPIRSLYRLALDPARLPAAIDTARAMPSGFRLAAFDPSDRAQAEAWVRVNAAAFASHPEQGGVTLDDFENLERETWFSADDLMLAFDTTHADRLAGYAWVKTTHADDADTEDPEVNARDEADAVNEAGAVKDSLAAAAETELYVLGVDPAYAGRGLGAALLGATLRRMKQHSPDRITLYVDGDNENARALYDRAGFVTDQLSTQWLLGERPE